MKTLILLIVVFAALPSFACRDDELKVIQAGCPKDHLSMCASRAVDSLLAGDTTAEMVLKMCKPNDWNFGDSPENFSNCHFDAISASADVSWKAAAAGCKNGKGREKCAEAALNRAI